MQVRKSRCRCECAHWGHRDHGWDVDGHIGRERPVLARACRVWCVCYGNDEVGIEGGRIIAVGDARTARDDQFDDCDVRVVGVGRDRTDRSYRRRWRSNNACVSVERFGNGGIAARVSSLRVD